MAFRKKLSLRDRKKIKIRKKIHGTDVKPRISVYKSKSQTYAQAISDVQGATLVSASTMDSDVKSKIEELKQKSEDVSTSSKSVLAAKAVGLVLGSKMLSKEISKGVFDRNGFIYHGRVKAVGDGVREAGLSL